MSTKSFVIALALLPLAACASNERMAAADAKIVALETKLADATTLQQAMRVRLDDALRLSTAAKLDATTALMMANR